MKVPPNQAGLSRFREETEMLKSIYGQVSFHIENRSRRARKNMDGQVNYILKISPCHFKTFINGEVSPYTGWFLEALLS